MMKSNFEFAGERVNYQLAFTEIATKKEFIISGSNYPGCSNANVHLPKGDFVLLPCKSGGNFDLWDIRNNCIIKSWVQLNDPIPDS